MFRDKYHAFIEAGLYDDIFVLFVDAMCYFEQNGVLGFKGLENLNFSPDVNKFISLCFDLIIDGTADFYFDFVVELEYQRMLKTIQDDKINTGLYLVKTLANLLRTRDRFSVYYLLQHHCEPDVSSALRAKMIDVFTEENVFMIKN